jgi:hypothetical protein
MYNLVGQFRQRGWPFLHLRKDNTLTTETTTVSVLDLPVTPTIDLDAGAAYANRGAKAAVFRPRHGQVHQQYCTPRWLCKACADITEKLFKVLVIQGQRGGYPLRIIDPTCGSGRLLSFEVKSW